MQKIAYFRRSENWLPGQSEARSRASHSARARHAAGQRWRAWRQRRAACRPAIVGGRAGGGRQVVGGRWGRRAGRRAVAAGRRVAGGESATPPHVRMWHPPLNLQRGLPLAARNYTSKALRSPIRRHSVPRVCLGGRGAAHQAHTDATMRAQLAISERTVQPAARGPTQFWLNLVEGWRRSCLRFAIHFRASFPHSTLRREHRAAGTTWALRCDSVSRRVTLARDLVTLWWRSVQQLARCMVGADSRYPRGGWHRGVDTPRLKGASAPRIADFAPDRDAWSERADIFLALGAKARFGAYGASPYHHSGTLGESAPHRHQS